jgi:deoxycytidylate deaminase
MEKQEIKKEIKYPFLPEGRTIKYVPADNPFMVEAKRVQQTLSTDKYFSTGAVVVKEGVIVGKGANQSLLRTQWLIKAHQKWACIRRWFNIPSGQKYWMCPGCSPSSQHAETRAALDAQKKGFSEGADMYLYGHWWCCAPCWGAIIDTGIKDVYLMEGSEILFDKNHPNNIVGKQF